MVNWSAFHGWMAFDRLSENEGLTRAFTIGYRLTDDPSDPWTARFNSFKQASSRERMERSQEETAALNGGAAVLSRYAIPSLVRGLGLNTSKTIFIPALSSWETVASPDSVLCRLTRFCARGVAAGFARDRITKKPHEKLHMQPDAARRTTVLADADFRSKKIRSDTVLVLDDFITRGATMSHIALAILKRNPGLKVFAVALAKTERRSHWRKFDVEISNDHVPPRWKRSWMNAR